MTEFPKRHTPTASYRVWNKETGEIVAHFRTKAAAEHVRWCRASCNRQELIHTPWSVSTRSFKWIAWEEQCKRTGFKDTAYGLQNLA